MGPRNCNIYAKIYNEPALLILGGGGGGSQIDCLILCGCCMLTDVQLQV